MQEGSDLALLPTCRLGSDLKRAALYLAAPAEDQARLEVRSARPGEPRSHTRCALPAQKGELQVHMRPGAIDGRRRMVEIY
ncbi:hypothetical protein ADK47_14920 [Streptomyces rimosus subsp. rimosus]|nr:hypothetical protein ADK78_17140 [Kitasatospora aureofaciens]KOT39494.1 hypothetical protein ADK84_14370 [Streptomyces sp. NRRL WC-3701]KOT57879.1 hypothetical protein ADK45_24455 [Streptomyces rimosus subsp. rimosus]QDA09091.1 hypothetical protein CTZ40_40510 [Streptomyces rimosus]KOT62284.1 hypothetical protein ADK44_13105 [Streptomyces rimosus subsp. rimosus]